MQKLFKKYNIDKSKLVNPFSWKSVKVFFSSLVLMKGKPSKIALSMALGIFIGLMMPVGFQTVIALPLALFFNLNILVTLTATLVTNPLTIVPLYFAIIRTGEFITQIKISGKKIDAVIKNPGLENFINLGYESLIVFFSGSFTFGVISSFIVYFITLKLIQKYRSRKSA